MYASPVSRQSYGALARGFGEVFCGASQAGIVWRDQYCMMQDNCCPRPPGTVDVKVKKDLGSSSSRYPLCSLRKGILESQTVGLENMVES